jgi:hypothetical protein
MTRNAMLKAAAKGLLRNLRDGGVSSAVWYLRAPQVESHLRKLIGNRLPSDDEVHVLTGADRLTMALWMAASWMASTGEYPRFVFHDDGNLGVRSADKVRRIFPGSRVVMESESAETMRSVLADYPLAWNCRNLHPLCRKLFDIPYFVKGDRFLAIDTDILFFRRPGRMLELTKGKQAPSVFLRDAMDWTLPEVVGLTQSIKVKLVRQVNTGIVAMPKIALDLQTLELCLRNSRLLDAPRWFIEQSLYALMASRFGDVELLPSSPDKTESYQNDLRERASSNAVMRHYVGKVRHLFYSEGIAKVHQMIREAQ